MRWLSILVSACVACSLAVILLGAPPALAGCDSTATLGSAQAGCQTDASQVKTLYASAATDGYRYRVRLWCAVRISDEQCAGAATPCADPPDSFLYEVLRGDLTGGTAWQVVGRACLGAGDLATLGAITPEMVLTAFRRLSWPKAELTVQPPGGETLVNFRTNLFTTNTEPTTQGVTLLGTDITIEATPSTYAWNFGQGAAVENTGKAGKPFPDLEVTHIYEDAHETVHPSVDVTYSGRYRIGNSAWVAIPGTVTVGGDPVDLAVIEGQPNLVG